MTKKKERNILKFVLLVLPGIIVLLIGFNPEIAAVFHFDTTPPVILRVCPGGTEEAPSPLTLNLSKSLYMVVDLDASPDTDFDRVTCKVRPYALAADNYITVALTWDDREGEFNGMFTYEWDCLYQLYWEVYDLGGRKSDMLTWAEVGDAAGDFWVKDGNDPDYVIVEKDASLTFDHYTVYFEFRATNNADDIDSVWVEIVGQTTLDLSEPTYGVWNGSSWTASSDGSYTVYGKFSAFSKEYTAMSILIGIPDEPVPPSPWSMHDWLKILGGCGLIVGCAAGWKRWK